MKYFKHKTSGEIFAYETSVAVKDNNLVEVSEDEALVPIIQDNTEAEERLWRDSELARADIELYKVQDSDPKAKGSVSEWREYRKALRAYPESEVFPNQESRPVAPDAA